MRLPASLRAAFYAAGLLVAASGVIWLFVRGDPRRLSAACMQVHGSAAMVLLVLVGAVAATRTRSTIAALLVGAVAALHAPTSWRERKNRGSGAVFAAALAVLLVSGALLYYLGDEGVRSVSSTLHWTVGCAALVLAGVHVWLGRRSRER